jgi:hypothetical protein
MTLRVLDPTAGTAVGVARPAPGVPSLQGARLAILDNGKIRVDRFCDFVEQILRAEYGVADVVRRRKRNASAPVGGDVLADLLECDGVISAVGD